MGEASTTDGRQPVRVMLADNHAMFRQSVASMLSKDGDVEVVGDAGNGPEAIELAKENRPDVIVMEVERKPEEAATEIGGMLEVSPDSRVVVLTIHQDPLLVREMTELSVPPWKVTEQRPDSLVVAVAADSEPLPLCTLKWTMPPSTGRP